MKYNRSRNKLAIGTEEGFVCIFDVTSDGLSFDKILDKQEGRVLSLDWHHDGFHIVTGSTGQRMFLLFFTYIPKSFTCFCYLKFSLRSVSLSWKKTFISPCSIDIFLSSSWKWGIINITRVWTFFAIYICLKV